MTLSKTKKEQISKLISSHKEMGSSKSWIKYRVKLAFSDISDSEFEALYKKA